jgi:hypothetical protein
MTQELEGHLVADLAGDQEEIKPERTLEFGSKSMEQGWPFGRL